MNQQQQAPYLNTSLSFEERAADLCSRMTLEEKISQLVHKAAAIPRLGVPEYNWWNECLHGVARAGRATVFPQAIAMAATFNVPLIHKVAGAISDEARAKHHQAIRQGNRGQYFGLTYWTPNINIFRDPRWGRGQETFGEDPYLTSRMGVAFVRGLQGDNPKYLKLVATPKHFAVHSGPEPLRHRFDAVVSRRDLHETYLRAFKACIVEGKAASIMGAYNRLYGEPCCASTLLLERILRGQWGFGGYVVSDCGAICDFHNHHKVTSSAAESAALALKRGCDLNCGDTYHHLRAAVQAGLVGPEDIDRSLIRLLIARFRLGMFDPPQMVPYADISPQVVNCDRHKRLAREVARQSFVLLKNENRLLPLNKDLKCLAVVGPSGYNLDVLHGNYTGFSPTMATFLEGLLQAVPVGTQVNWCMGCEHAGQGHINLKELEVAVRDAQVIIAAMGYTPALEGEEAEMMGVVADGGGDRLSIGLPGRQLELLQMLHETGKPIVLVLTGGSAIELNWAAANIPAILMTWYPGEQAGQALADVLFGDYSPSGRLPITFYKSLEQVPPFEDYNMAGRTYRFMQDQPLYHFGYGLSYTKFAYSNLRLSRKTISKNGQVRVSVDVANVGDRAGDEVVQLYVSDVEASVPVPLQHLEGFAKIHLEPGQKRTVHFTLSAEQLAAYDEDGQPFVEPGLFNVSVGGWQPQDPSGGAVTAQLKVE